MQPPATVLGNPVRLPLGDWLDQLDDWLTPRLTDCVLNLWDWWIGRK